MRTDRNRREWSGRTILVGDTHYLANKEKASRLDERSSAVTGRLVDVLNRLPGTAIPAGAGGGTVLPPRGLIHAGDCIDSGDKPHTTMQETEWAAFADGFGLTGKDGKLKLPIYEVHGNHDSPRGDGLAVQEHRRAQPASRPSALQCRRTVSTTGGTGGGCTSSTSASSSARRRA